MRRTQLYLDDQLWNALHARAASERTTISELVRQAVRDRYLSNRAQRMKAMSEFVGIRKDLTRTSSAVEQIRALRRGSRLELLNQR